MFFPSVIDRLAFYSHSSASICVICGQNFLRSADRQKAYLSLILFLLVTGWSAPVFADMVFPARLELVETQRGLFQVQFNLPVQNMARMKATPVLPAVCAALAPPDEASTASSYTATWQVNCPADALPGQSIGVDGLLGSRTDLLLSIKTLEGRQYRAMLKPARASYVIPRPPSFAQIGGHGLVEGMRASFVRIDLFLLTGLLVLFSSRRWSAIGALMMGGIGYAVAQALAQENLLLVPASLPGVLVLMSCVYFASRLAAGGDSAQKRRVPLWLAGVLTGALYGGALRAFQPAQEFSRFEHATAFFAHSLGIMVGLLLIYWLCVELRQLLRFIPGLQQDAAARRILATLTGIAALGLLLYQLSASSVLPTLVPTAPPIFFVVAAILGIYAARAERGNLSRWSAAGLLLVAGLITGALGHRLPYDTVVVPLTLFALGIGLVANRELPGNAGLVLIALTALYSAAQAGLFIQENLSRAMAHLAGSGLLAAFVFLAAFSISGRHRSRFSTGTRIAGAAGAAVALLVWAQGYADWLHSAFASDYAMGMLPIPLLSLALVVLAMLAWPRRSRVAAHLNTEVRKPVAHFAFLVLALFLLNVGTVQAPNPLYEQDAPRPGTGETDPRDHARQYLQRVQSKERGAAVQTAVRECR